MPSCCVCILLSDYVQSFYLNPAAKFMYTSVWKQMSIDKEDRGLGSRRDCGLVHTVRIYRERRGGDRESKTLER